MITKLVFRPKIKVLLLIIPMLIVSCTRDQPSSKELERTLRSELPVGTAKVDVEKFLVDRNINYSEGIREPILDDFKSGRTYNTLRASINLDESFLFRNPKIIIDFYLDDDDGLVDLRVVETSSMP